MKKLIVLLMLSVLFIHANFTVSYAGGKNFLLRDGNKVRLKTGIKLKTTDIIITGPRGFAAIRSNDGSVYKILAGTVARLNSYVNDNSKRKASFTLGRGKVFSFVSKTFKKSDVKFLTSNGVVGVRGTSFLLDNSKDNLTVYLTEGSVSIFDTKNISKPIGVVNSGQIGEKPRGKSTVKITPLTENKLDRVTREIPNSVQELNDSFGRVEVPVEEEGSGEEEISSEEEDSGEEELSSEEEELLSGDLEEVTASDLDALSKEESLSIDQEVDLINQENDELRLQITETLIEVEDTLREIRQEIAERQILQPKTIDGYDIEQYYQRNGNTVSIISTSSKDNYVNSINLSLTYGGGISTDSFNAGNPPVGLTESSLSIMGFDTRDRKSWGVVYQNDSSGGSSVSLRSPTPSSSSYNFVRGDDFVSFNDSPSSAYDRIFLKSIANIAGGGGVRLIEIDYQVVDDDNRALFDSNSTDQRQLFNHLYPNVLGVPYYNRNVRVDVNQVTEGVFGGKPDITAYYFTDGFKDYVYGPVDPLLFNPFVQ